MNTKKHLQFCKCFFCCIPEGARTLDPLIKSQLLYQLSYGNNFLSCCKSTLFFLLYEIYSFDFYQKS